MALRRQLGRLAIAAAAVCAWTACKDKGDATKAAATTELDARCEKLAKRCGDNDKHVTKIVDECKQAAKAQAESGCTAKTIAAYDCFEKELCGTGENVWALDDLRVLAERHHKCAAEQTASHDCAVKK